MVTTEKHFMVEGKEVRLRVPAGDHIDVKIGQTKGLYEKNPLLFLLRKSIIDKTTAVVDVGACIGNHTVFFGLFCKSVTSFEPRPKSFQLLEENVALNNLTNVRALKLAVAARSGEVDIRFFGVDRRGRPNIGMTYWWYKGEKINSEWHRSDMLRRCKADCSCRSMPLDDAVTGDVDFIKIDVEGMEVEVLKGAKRVVETNSPVIMIEILRKRTEPLIRDWAKEYSYSVIGEFGNNLVLKRR